MKQEDRQLLLKDLSARLPYGVIVDYKEDEYDFHHWKISTLHAPAYSQSGSLINTDSDGWIEYNEYEGCGMSSGSRPLDIEKNLPFLRSMSSMTEDEKKEYEKACDLDMEILLNHPMDGTTPFPVLYNPQDYLNSIHVDYRGLIPMGLALEAPKDMYKL